MVRSCRSFEACKESVISNHEYLLVYINRVVRSYRRLCTGRVCAHRPLMGVVLDAYAPGMHGMDVMGKGMTLQPQCGQRAHTHLFTSLNSCTSSRDIGCGAPRRSFQPKSVVVEFKAADPAVIEDAKGCGSEAPKHPYPSKKNGADESSEGEHVRSVKTMTAMITLTDQVFGQCLVGKASTWGRRQSKKESMCRGEFC